MQEFDVEITLQRALEKYPGVSVSTLSVQFFGDKHRFTPAELWRMYRHRGEAENKIKELKYDFGFDSFNLRGFYATEAALSFVMLAYNLMSLFRHFVLHSEIQRRLSTLRYNTFAIGSYLVRDGNQVTLKMELILKRREWFIGFWEKSRAFAFPVTFSNA